jgi:hypothetical protein
MHTLADISLKEPLVNEITKTLVETYFYETPEYIQLYENNQLTEEHLLELEFQALFEANILADLIEEFGDLKESEIALLHEAKVKRWESVRGFMTKMKVRSMKTPEPDVMTPERELALYKKYLPKAVRLYKREQKQRKFLRKQLSQAARQRDEAVEKTWDYLIKIHNLENKVGDLKNKLQNELQQSFATGMSFMKLLKDMQSQQSEFKKKYAKLLGQSIADGLSFEQIRRDLEKERKEKSQLQSQLDEYKQLTRKLTDQRNTAIDELNRREQILSNPLSALKYSTRKWYSEKLKPGINSKISKLKQRLTSKPKEVLLKLKNKVSSLKEKIRRNKPKAEATI